MDFSQMSDEELLKPDAKDSTRDFSHISDDELLKPDAQASTLDFSQMSDEELLRPDAHPSGESAAPSVEPPKKKDELGFWERKRLELEEKTGKKTSWGDLVLNKTIGFGIDEAAEANDEWREIQLMNGKIDDPGSIWSEARNMGISADDLAPALEPAYIGKESFKDFIKAIKDIEETPAGLSDGPSNFSIIQHKFKGSVDPAVMKTRFADIAKSRLADRIKTREAAQSRLHGAEAQSGWGMFFSGLADMPSMLSKFFHPAAIALSTGVDAHNRSTRLATDTYTLDAKGNPQIAKEYATDQDGNVLLDADGNPVVKRELRGETDDVALSKGAVGAITESLIWTKLGALAKPLRGLMLKIPGVDRLAAKLAKGRASAGEKLVNKLGQSSSGRLAMKTVAVLGDVEEKTHLGSLPSMIAKSRLTEFCDEVVGLNARPGEREAFGEWLDKVTSAGNNADMLLGLLGMHAASVGFSAAKAHGANKRFRHGVKGKEGAPNREGFVAQYIGREAAKKLSNKDLDVMNKILGSGRITPDNVNALLNKIAADRAEAKARMESGQTLAEVMKAWRDSRSVSQGLQEGVERLAEMTKRRAKPGADQEHFLDETIKEFVGEDLDAQRKVKERVLANLTDARELDDPQLREAHVMLAAKDVESGRDGHVEDAGTARSVGEEPQVAASKPLELFKQLDEGKLPVEDVAVGGVEPLAPTENGNVIASYDPAKAKPIVVWEDLEGNRHAVTGGKRISMATASGAETVKAVVVREADGWSEAEARGLGATENLREGHGGIKNVVEAVDSLGADHVAELAGWHQANGSWEFASTIRKGLAVAQKGGTELKAALAEGRIEEDFAYNVAQVLSMERVGEGWEAAQRELAALVGKVGPEEMDAVLWGLKRRLDAGEINDFAAAIAEERARYNEKKGGKSGQLDSDAILMETEDGDLKTLGEMEAEQGNGELGTGNGEVSRVNAAEAPELAAAEGAGQNKAVALQPVAEKPGTFATLSHPNARFTVDGEKKVVHVEGLAEADFAAGNAEKTAALVARVEAYARENGLSIGFNDDAVMEAWRAAREQIKAEAAERFAAKDREARRVTVVDQLKKSGLAEGVVETAEDFNRMFEEMSGEALRAGEEVYGFVDPKTKKIYLNPEFFATGQGLEAPIHEFGHLGVIAAEKVNKAVYDRGMKLATDFLEKPESAGTGAIRELVDLITNDRVYSAQGRKVQAEELLAQLIGKRGAEALKAETNASVVAKVKSWLVEFWNTFGKALGLKDITPEQTENMTLEDVADAIRAEMFSGRKYGEGLDRVEFTNGGAHVVTKPVRIRKKLAGRRKAVNEFVNRMGGADDPANTETDLLALWVDNGGRLFDRMPFEVETSYSKGATGVKKTRRAVADEFAESTAFYRDLDPAQRKVFFGSEKLETGPIGEGLKNALEAAGITRFTNEDGTVDYEAVIGEFKRQWTNYERGEEVLKERNVWQEERDRAFVEEMERAEQAEYEAVFGKDEEPVAIWTDRAGTQHELKGFSTPSKENLIKGNYVAIRHDNGVLYSGELVSIGSKNVKVKTQSDMYGEQVLKFPAKDIVGVKQSEAQIATQEAQIAADLAAGRFSRGGIFTGTAADYADRSRQGGVDDGPSLLKIGTGEGSQVYGWGLYGSTVRGVAEGYAGRRKQSQDLMYKGHDIAPVFKFPRNATPKELALKFARMSSSVEGLLSNLEYEGRKDKSYKPQYEAAVEWVKNHRSDFTERPRGNNLYEQTFFTDRAPGDESHLLKWYEPVSEEQRRWIANELVKEGWQRTRDTVRTVYRQEYDSYHKGENEKDYENKIHLFKGAKASELYRDLSELLGTPRAASEFLARAGIDGVKYPVDSYGGKGVKDGDEVGWNYVSFRDDNIRVDHKWTDGQMRFSRFAGEKGAENMGVGNANHARSMESAGADREKIWRETGWWKGKDGKWRFELPSAKMKGEKEVEAALRINDRGSSETTLEKLLDAPELFRAYPQLKDTKITLSPEHNDEAGGWYDVRNNEIVLFDTGLKSLKHLPFRERDLRDTYQKVIDSDEYIRQRFEDMDALGIKHGTAGEEREYAKKWIERQDRNIRSANETMIRDLVKDRSAYGVFAKIVHEVQHAVQRIEGFARGGSVKEEDYARIAGEVEARNASRREAMTPAERAATPPWETEDVPLERQLLFSRAKSVTGPDGSETYKVESNGKTKRYKTPKEALEDFIKELDGQALNEEQQGIYDVVTGVKNTADIRKNDLGELVKFHKGGRGKGAGKIIAVHYAGKRGKVTAKEVIDIGQVIRSGTLDYDGTAEHPYSHTYTATASDGAELKVVIDLDKKGNEAVINFYSDRKTGNGGQRPHPVSTTTSSSPQSIPNSGAGAQGGVKLSRGKPPEAKLVKTTRVADDAGQGEQTPGAIAASAELMRTTPTPLTQKGTRYVSLPLSELHALSRYLTGHAMPAEMESGKKLGKTGKASLKHRKLTIAADVLGVVDKTDAAAETATLKQHGFFKHEDANWCATHSPSEVRQERARSEDALSSRLEALADRRIAGREPGGNAAGRKVFADQLAKVVMSMPHGQPGVLGAMQTVAGALEKRVRGSDAEADAFIDWMKGGAPQGARDAQTRKLEMFSAFLIMPKEMESRAKGWYDAIRSTIAADQKLADTFRKMTARSMSEQGYMHLEAEILRMQNAQTEAAIKKLQAEANEPIKAGGKLDQAKETVVLACDDRMGAAAVRVDAAAKVYLAAQKKLMAAAKTPAEKAQIKQQTDLFMGKLAQAKNQAELSRTAWERGRDNADARYLWRMVDLLNEATVRDGLKTQDLSLYLDQMRVIETRGLSGSRGESARQAQLVLDAMRKRLGGDFAKVEAFARKFHAIHEQELLNNPLLEKILGKGTADYWRSQTSYVTTKRTFSPEELAEIEAARRVLAASGAAGGDTVVGQMFKYCGRPEATAKLKGSFADKQEVMSATFEKVAEVQRFLRRSEYVIQLRDMLKLANVEGVHDLPAGKNEFKSNKRYGSISYMENGHKRTLVVPREIADGFERQAMYDTGALRICAAVNNIARQLWIDWNPVYWQRNISRNAGSIEMNMPGMRESIVKRGARFVFPGLAPVTEMAMTHLVRHMPERMSLPLRRLWGEHTALFYAPKAKRMAMWITDHSEMQRRLWDAQKRGDLGAVQEMMEDQRDMLAAMRANMLVGLGAGKAGGTAGFLDDSVRTVGKTMQREMQELAATPKWRRALNTINIFEKNAKQQVFEDIMAKFSAYLHDRAQFGKGNNRTAEESGLIVKKNVSIGEGERKGESAGMVQAIFQPFWNMVEKGVVRNVKAYGERPGETFQKAAWRIAPMLLQGLVGSGAIAAWILKANDGDEEKVKAGPMGDVYNYLRDAQRAYQNCSNYVRNNYHVTPLFTDGYTSVVIGMPLTDEERLLKPIARFVTDAAAVAAGTKESMDVAGFLSDATGVIAPDFKIAGALPTLLDDTVHALMENPTDYYTGGQKYDKDLYAVRNESWEMRGKFAAAMGKRLWNDFGGRNVLPVDRAGVDNGLGKAPGWVAAMVNDIPIVSPILRSFVKVQVGSPRRDAAEITEAEQKRRSVCSVLAKELFGEARKAKRDVSMDTEKYCGLLQKWEKTYGLTPDELASIEAKYINAWRAYEGAQYKADGEREKFRAKAEKLGLDAANLWLDFD